MKKLLVLSSLLSLSLITSCNKSNDEIEVISQEKISKTENYCKNTDNALIKMYEDVTGDKELVKEKIDYAIQLHSKMNEEFRQNEENRNKVLYLKMEPSVLSDKGIEELLISIHISNKPTKPLAETTSTLYTGSEFGAKYYLAEYSLGMLLSKDPCSPVISFEFDGVWYVEDCC